MIERTCARQKRETGEEYLERMCEDAAEDADNTRRAQRDLGPGDWTLWNCEQINPELARKLKAEHEQFLKDHPIQPHYYAGSSLESDLDEMRTQQEMMQSDIEEMQQKHETELEDLRQQLEMERAYPRY